MKRVKYICYYDVPENRSYNRRFAPSAATVIDYICDVLNENGDEVEIVSASGSNNKKGCRGTIQEIRPGRLLKTFSSFGTANRLVAKGDFWMIKLKLLMELLFHTTKADKVLVYHSLYYADVIRFAKRIRKFSLILQVEEIYQDVIQYSRRYQKLEYQLIDLADSYILPTELLNEKINKVNKPYCVLYGTYASVPEYRSSSKDGKIHVIYAGTFDPRKGGAAAAAAAAAYLNKNYHIHIIGFGNQHDTKSLQNIVNDISKTSECTITFDGLKSGEEYFRFIQSCDIGLSTQDPNADFNDTSFPSKILSYLTNGLKVVSIRIPAVERSKISSELFYYDQQTPEAIASTIQKAARASRCESRRLIRELSDEFKAKLANLLSDVC